MRHPWANVLLLLLGTLELVTGLLGLLWGSPDTAIALHIHRAGGFTIVALLIWKSQNILPSLLKPRRWRRFKVSHSAFTLTLGLLLLVLSLGLVWSHGGSFYVLGFSGVSWHIYLSVALVPPVLWHTLFHRRTLRPRFWADRRTFLRFSGLSVAGILLWRIGESGAGLLGLPGPTRRFTGSYQAGSLSGNDFPATSWINDHPMPVDSNLWRLSVTGRVQRDLSLTYDEIAEHQGVVTATLDCTGGWYSTQEWQGVSLKGLLERAWVNHDAASVTVRSVTGYYRRFSLKEASEYILATRVGDEPLSHRHGFPLRLVAPGKRGYDWVKWVTAIQVNDTGKWLQPPLPLQ